MRNQTIINMKLYTNDGHKMIAIIKDFIDINYRNLSNNEVNVNRIIKNDLMPKDDIIVTLYTELFASFYSGLWNASLSVGVILLEYLSKKEYMNITQLEDYPSFDWDKVMLVLAEEYKNKARKKQLLELIDQIRSEVRNYQQHGDFCGLTVNCSSNLKVDLNKTMFGQNQYIKLINTPLIMLNRKEKNQKEQITNILRKPSNKWTLKEFEIIRKLSQSRAKLIPEKELSQVQSELGARCISLVNIFIVEFYILRESAV